MGSRTAFFLISMVESHGVPNVFVTEPDIVVEVAPVIRQGLPLELDDVSAYFVQEAAIVRNHKKRVLVRA
jgi:hypothetical protein